MGKEKRPFCCHKIFIPNGLSAPAWGYIHVKKNNIKNGKKSDFKENCLKLARNCQSDKGFLLTSKFCPQGFSALAPGLYTCIKSLKMCIKSDFEETILKLATYRHREKAFLLPQNICLQWVVCPCLVLYTYEKNTHKKWYRSDVKMIFFKLATNGQIYKGFLLTSTFVPKGLSAPALGLYTCIKALKYIPGQGVR